MLSKQNVTDPLVSLVFTRHSCCLFDVWVPVFGEYVRVCNVCVCVLCVRACCVCVYVFLCACMGLSARSSLEIWTG